MRVLKAAGLYFVAVFAAGFALGVLRAFWLAPALGERAAQLLEMPVMLVVMVLASRRIVPRLAVEPRYPPRLGMGAIAVLLVVVAEFALALPVRGMTPAQYLAGLDPLTGSVYYAVLAVMAALPLFAPPAVSAARRAVLASLLASVAVAAVVIGLKYRHDMGVALQRVASGSDVAQTACGPIEYASYGRGPAVVMVHGAGGGFDQTAGFAQEIAARGFRVIAMSRFGYLRTPRPAQASAATQADAHACLLDALKIPRAAIIGASAGAPSAMQFSLRHAERCTALVLLVPIAYAPQSAQRFEPPPASARWMIEQGVKSDLLYWLASELAPSFVTGSILATPPALVERADADEQARVAWMRRQILPLSPRQQGLLLDVEILTTLPRYELERIHAPTLVISARDDGFGTYAGSLYTAQHVAGARFLGLPDGGHLWVGHHREVMGEIVSFIATSAR